MADFERVLEHEHAISPSLDGRSVFDDRKEEGGAALAVWVTWNERLPDFIRTMKGIGWPIWNAGIRDTCGMILRGRTVRG